MPQLVSSKNLLLSAEPVVVGVVNTQALLETLSQDAASLAGSCDAIELRLDTIGLPASVLRPLAERLSLPRIITARHPEEGGDGQLDTAERTALLEDHLDIAALMDVELRSVPDMLPLVRKAQTKGISVIGSFHDFHSTPSEDVLQGAVDFGLQFKLDAVKIATMLHGPADLARLINLLSKERRLPISVMGMGNLGKVSRPVLARCGSILNYGFLGEANAPGQLSARRLKEWLSEA